MSLTLRYAARSDRGLVRGNNEDSVYAGPRLLALADGMGGHAAGEVASQLIIAALAPLDRDEPDADLLSQLNAAVTRGNQSVADHAEEDSSLAGMGTTLTALLFSDNRVGLCHVGDSRAYLLRGGKLAQITRDDTFVQTLVEDGQITAEEAHSHPQRSLIMKALTGEPVEPTLVIREVRNGDRYLICSDGLSDPVSFDTISETLSEGTPASAAERLIDLALRSGGPDNVTVVVADVVEGAAPSSQPEVAGALATSEETPRPNTAAGRAAAMRPAPTAQRRVVTAEPAEAKGRRTPLWLLGMSAGALGLLLLIVGAVVVIARQNYFVGVTEAQDSHSEIVIYRGLAGSILSQNLAAVDTVACLEGEELSTYAKDQAPTTCTPLQLSDLKPAVRSQVESGMPSGDRPGTLAQLSRLQHEGLLPLCPAPSPSETPTPGASERPRGTTTAQSTTRPAPTGTPSTPDPNRPAATSNPATPENPTQVPGETCREVG